MTTEGRSGCIRSSLVFGLAVGLLAAGVVAVDIDTFLKHPVVPESETVHVVIPRGTRWRQVVQIAQDQGLIRRPLYFDIWARRQGLPDRVKAGHYALVGPLSLAEFAESLTQGGIAEEVTLTVPEGLTIFHIADRLERAGIVDRADFLRAARDSEALAAHHIHADSFEGYLFPDTYRFSVGVAAPELVDRMVKRHESVWASLLLAHPESVAAMKNRGFSERDMITLASLVERESNDAAERPRIARVFLNRLDRGMKLQTDPTCVYGEDTYKEIPHPKFCKDPLNRYSTYVIDGLPPGPISNPGKSSLEAALNPSDPKTDGEYLFFVAKNDGSGTHYFSKTFEEHRKAVRRFLK